MSILYHRYVADMAAEEGALEALLDFHPFGG